VILSQPCILEWKIRDVMEVKVLMSWSICVLWRCVYWLT